MSPSPSATFAHLLDLSRPPPPLTSTSPINPSPATPHLHHHGWGTRTTPTTMAAYMRVTHRDEEGKKVTEKMPIPETRRPDTAKYIERKLEEQGLHRFERHPANAPRGVGIGTPPPKSGRGGKFTWDGPGGVVEDQLDPAPPAIDPNDPNYEEEQEEGGGAPEEEAVVVGEVEVAKVAENRDGVARVDVAPPLLQEQAR